MLTSLLHHCFVWSSPHPVDVYLFNSLLLRWGIAEGGFWGAVLVEVREENVISVFSTTQ